MAIRVLVAEDMRLLREAIVTLLSDEDDIEVVVAVENGDEIVPQALRHQPDVAVVDIDLPRLDGLAAATLLKAEVPTCRTLILTALNRPGNLRRSVEAQVAGFMAKDASPEDLAAAIRTIADGGMVIDPQLAYATLHADDGPLTEREREVMRLMASGAEPREIAAQLHLTYGTVRNHLGSAVTKLGARNRVDAIRIATKAGWL